MMSIVYYYWIILKQVASFFQDFLSALFHFTPVPEGN